MSPLPLPRCALFQDSYQTLKPSFTRRLVYSPVLRYVMTLRPGTTFAKSVEINFSADRNQLFSAWNAIANLADLAGKVSVTVRADSAEGFGKGKLQNGVLEPLRESDLIK